MYKDKINKRKIEEKDFHNHIFETKARKKLSIFYQLSKKRRKRYQELLLKNCSGKKVLEYGCGLSSTAFLLASKSAYVTGVDISEYAINEMNKKKKEYNVNINFEIMDAESLSFKDNEFDIICGTGILHHLNLNKSIGEIKRCLKPNGEAIFVEPLGHNPLINFFRCLTPSFRSKDEHPLKIKDIELIKKEFRDTKMIFYNLTTFFSLLFFKTKYFDNIFNVLKKIDDKL